jgi:hypothetical protein
MKFLAWILAAFLLAGCASRPSETLGGLGFDLLKLALQAAAGL